MSGGTKGSNKYKLIYFDIRGRGEIPRLLFHAAKVDFKDERLDNEEEWYTNIKPKMPQKVLPVLEVDGKQLSQSLTICRYLAREFGLTGKTNWEQAHVEQIADTMEDLRAEVAKWIYEKDKDKKTIISSNLSDEIYPKFIGILEKVLRANGENNNRSGYLVGDILTLADLSVYETFTFPLSIHTNILDDHLEVLEHRTKIESHPHLVEYIKDRPVRQTLQQVLPVLKVERKQISQSLTIGRYLARQYGLTGKTNLEMAQVEEIADTMDDLRNEVAKWIYEKDTEKKLTLADLSVYETFTFSLSIHPNILDNNLEVLDHRTKIETHPNLAEYIKDHPVRQV